MQIGISMIYKRVDDSAPNPGTFALECEQLGLESVWVGDHMLFHAHPKTPFPAGGAIPDHYAHFPEPFVVLAMAAATTKKLRIGTSVLLMPEHEPLTAAKTIATLDRLSGGRVILGVGSGWLREAAVPLGSDFDHRWTQAGEYVAAMRELWSKPVASFHGKYANFDDIVCNPKPLQQPGPPVLIGSLDKNALKRVAKWADGWCPIRLNALALKERVDELKRECAAVGRDFAKLDITIMGGIAGDRAKVQDSLKEFAAAGAHRFVAGVGDLTSSGQFDYKSSEETLKKIASLYV